MATDYITWFTNKKSGDRGAQGEYVNRDEKLRVYYCREQSEADKLRDSGDWNTAVRSGGIRFRFDYQSFVVDTNEVKGYEPPRRAFRLGFSSRPDEIKLPGTRHNVNAGEHLLVPVDQEAEAELADLLSRLQGLPDDQARSVIEALRRPSLEMRVARLEKISQNGSRGKVKESVLAGRTFFGSVLAWGGNKYLLATACILGAMGLAFYAGRRTAPAVESKETTIAEYDKAKKQEIADAVEKKHKQIPKMPTLDKLLDAMLDSQKENVRNVVQRYDLSRDINPLWDRKFASAMLELESGPAAKLSLAHLLLCQAYDVDAPCDELRKRPQVEARIKDLIASAGQTSAQRNTPDATPPPPKKSEKKKEKVTPGTKPLGTTPADANNANAATTAEPPRPAVVKPENK